MKNTSIVLFSGSPRKRGNTDMLAASFMAGAEEAGARVEHVRLYSRDIGPCLECGGCDKTGQCVLEDDMASVYPMIEQADVIAVSSPIFFYNITSRTQALVERSQAMWVRKYVLKQGDLAGRRRSGIFLSAGATRGKLLFDGVIRVMRYFFDAVSSDLHAALLIRGVEKRGDIKGHPFALKRARQLGNAVALGGDVTALDDVWYPGKKQE